MEWKRDSAFTYRIRNRKITFGVSELIGHERLKIRRREIIAYLDTSLEHPFQKPVTLLEAVLFRQAHHKYEPAHPAPSRGLRHDQSVVTG